MRRLLPPASLALLLAACSVGVEGAPCQSDANCPEGQACEYAGRCSKAAAACPGLICHQDACAAGGAQACVPDAARVCAALAAPVACGGGASCGVVGGTAECIAAAITAPTSYALVGASVPVTATLTFGAAGFDAPATIGLLGGGAPAATLSRVSIAGQVATYSGTYLPAAGVESDVGLTASVGSTPPVESPPLTVQVDTRPPVISAASAACPQSPCYRDDVLTVDATATDAHLSSVMVSVSLDSFSLSAPLASGSAQLALGTWPFQKLLDTLTARVIASDAAGNVSSLDVPVAGGITRVRQAFDTGTTKAVTSPAIDGSGTAICGVADTTGQLQGFKPDGTAAWTPPTTLAASPGAGMPVVAAPSIGAFNMFIGSEDGRIYRALPTGALAATFPYWPTSTASASLFTPAIVPVTGSDHAYTAGGAAKLYQFCSENPTVNEATLDIVNAVQAAGVVANGTPIFVTSTGSAATLRRFADVPSAPAQIDSLPLTDGATPPVACDKVEVPMAVDAQPGTTPPNVIAACANGQIHRVSTGAALADQLLYQLPAGVKPAGAPIVSRDGDIVLPAGDGSILKLTPGATTAALAWTTSVAALAGEVPTGIAAMSPVAAVAGADFVVTTSQGRVVALDLMGTVRWSGIVPGSPGALGFPTVAPVPPGGSAYALPTLVAGSSSGKLVRVVVDGVLDATAPWPKAHHDLRNTGNRNAPLP